MQNTKTTFLSAIAVSLLAVTLLAGCGTQKSDGSRRNKMPGDFEQMQNGTGSGGPRGERPATAPTQVENSADEEIVE